VGWESRPWSYAAGSGDAELDPEDCSVWEQCASDKAQVLAYEAYFAAFYGDNTRDWFDGTLFWLWRSDPTTGGPSNDGFSPQGKPASVVIATAWGLPP